MAYDIFLKLDGISGESTDDKHPHEIVLESFSWGESNSTAHATAGGAGAGRVSMQDFHFTARVSKASPTLMLYCASGKHIPTGQMSLSRTGEDRSAGDFLVYKFTTVVVSSFSQAGDINDRPLESVSLAFAKVNIEYKAQKSDGSLEAPVHFAWDLKANKSA
ncbi:MAG TPA: type VI secretion system tube protein Hcp [Candidatus Dormibacteraeota bacterium]|jgi:type VI secretion system secreted protein Hcp